jgi:hypothetical protein
MQLNVLHVKICFFHRGTGGEMMRFAVCQYINKLSLAQVPFHGDPVIGVWQTVLDDNIPHIDHNDPWIQVIYDDLISISVQIILVAIIPGISCFCPQILHH